MCCKDQQDERGHSKPYYTCNTLVSFVFTCTAQKVDWGTHKPPRAVTVVLALKDEPLDVEPLCLCVGFFSRVYLFVPYACPLENKDVQSEIASSI